jgi:hypothetical protein
MEIKISIADESIAKLSSAARDELCTQVKKYADYVVKEAHLLEEDARVAGAKGEITSQTIIIATQKHKNNPATRKPKWVFWVKLASTFSLLFSGALLGGAFFGEGSIQTNTTQFAFLVVCLVTACVTTVLVYIKEQ